MISNDDLPMEAGAIRFLRRAAAAEYLQEKYGFTSKCSLAKFACLGGGPVFRKFGKGVVVYTVADLDAWALGKLSGPMRSTSDTRHAK